MDTRRRWVVATAAASALVAAAPYIGDLQRWLRGALGASYVLVVNGAVAALAIGALAWAASTIRDRIGRRVALLAGAAALAAAYAWWSGLASAESNAVERFHFVEYGLITLLFYRASASVVVAVLMSLSVGALDEWIQHLAPGRIGEVRDIFLNVAAIACGGLVSVAVGAGGSRATLTPARGRRQRVVAATVAAGLVGSFVWTVHRGFVIADDEVEFESRFDAETLRSHASDPAAAAPRLAWGPENQYVTEALWHVQARNERWSESDFAAAWGENRILEKYFAVVLDAGHAWPAVQRTDARQRLGAGVTARYRSAAARLWIFQTPW